MRSALYYPHTTITNIDVVKRALLLWDRLEFIVPWESFKPQYRDRGIAQAMDVIGDPHCPSEDEKHDTHDRLKELLARRIPPQFLFRRDHRDDASHYDIYPQKFLYESWRLLQKAHMAGKLQDNSDYPLSEHGGLLVMSLLADSCAGTTRARVTDRGDAYATVTGFLGPGPRSAAIKKVDARGQLVPIVLKALDTSSVDLKKLIHLREREARESGHTLRDLRHRYVDSLENYVTKLVNEKTTKADARVVQREYEEDMESDLKDLRSELGFARRDAIYSKEILVTTLASIGTAASWLFGTPLHLEGVATVAGVPATIGGLLASWNKYLKDRQSILKKHPMAYFYEARLRRR